VQFPTPPPNPLTKSRLWGRTRIDVRDKISEEITRWSSDYKVNANDNFALEDYALAA